MDKKEIEVAGNVYRIGKLSVMQQFHVARKLAPILGSMTDTLKEAAKQNDQDGELLMKVMEPMANALAQMSFDDSEFVVNTCLATVERKDGQGFQKIKAGSQFQYADIDLGVMMRLTFAVIQENLGNFFRGPPAQ
jgi:hypothetical protein